MNGLFKDVCRLTGFLWGGERGVVFDLASSIVCYESDMKWQTSSMHPWLKSQVKSNELYVNCS